MVAVCHRFTQGKVIGSNLTISRCLGRGWISDGVLSNGWLLDQLPKASDIARTSTLLDFLCQKAEQGSSYGVVAEVEVFQMDNDAGHGGYSRRDRRT